jgi:UDP-2,3-diacylglucosamine pyrophosphatase LpxH
MRTSIREERLIVISDLHIGNPLHRPGRKFMDFAQFALDNRYSVCINGDGIDIAQLSLARLQADFLPSLGLFMQFGDADLHVYHTVGNHDIALEHFLSEMGRMTVVPFLNVYTGDKRIRVEHGHMYDGMFIKFPKLYFLFTMIGRMAIGISPKFYDRLHHANLAFIAFVEWVFSGFKSAEKRKKHIQGGIDGERECFRYGAEDVGMRGFDAVIFGHTHLPGTSELPNGVKYYNTGGWFTNPHCVVLDHGRIWFGTLEDLIQGDPFPQPRKTALPVSVIPDLIAVPVQGEMITAIAATS